MTKAARSRAALVLQHDRGAGSGLLGRWLGEQGFEERSVVAPNGEELPGLDGFDLLVLLGSEHSAADDLPWIVEEIELVREAHRAGLPTLGICFGGQLMARALGGEVTAGRVAEIGWREIESRRPELISAGPWFEWHFDVLEAPAGAEVLAASPHGVEAFQLDRSFGLQFHPEVDPEIIGTWAVDSRAELDQAGVTPDSLYEGMGEAPLYSRAGELFDGIGDRIGLTRRG